MTTGLKLESVEALKILHIGGIHQLTRELVLLEIAENFNHVFKDTMMYIKWSGKTENQYLLTGTYVKDVEGQSVYRFSEVNVCMTKNELGELVLVIDIWILYNYLDVPEWLVSSSHTIKIPENILHRPWWSKKDRIDKTTLRLLISDDAKLNDTILYVLGRGKNILKDQYNCKGY